MMRNRAGRTTSFDAEPFSFLVIIVLHIRCHANLSSTTRPFPTHINVCLCVIVLLQYCIPYRTFFEVMDPRFSISFPLMRTHALVRS